jgi:5-methylcytosine-specific restriction endonuclease McrA
MDSATRELVRVRAANLCEYCLLPQENCSLIHHIEHVVAKQHGGTDDIGNLALACHRCNLRKGPNLTGVDPVTTEIVRLYNPRQDRWTEHFQLVEAVIVGITAIGRTTIHVLSINDARRVELRSLLRRR